jgi:hypothetical protein
LVFRLCLLVADFVEQLKKLRRVEVARTIRDDLTTGGDGGDGGHALDAQGLDQRRLSGIVGVEPERDRGLIQRPDDAAIAERRQLQPAAPAADQAGARGSSLRDDL